MLTHTVRATVLGALLLAGCAAPQTQKSTEPQPMRKVSSEDTQTTQPREGVICTVEKRTGSNLPQRTCYTKEAIEARRKADQELLNRGGRTGPTNGSGGASNLNF